MNNNKSRDKKLSVSKSDDNEHSPISSKEWALLTYIVRTYDVDTAIQICQNTNSKEPKRKTLDPDFFQEDQKRSKLSLNFLKPSPSLLSDNQRMLLSNIISTYDKHSAVPVIQRILSRQSSYQPKIRFKLKCTLNIINIFSSSLNIFLNQTLSRTMTTQTCHEYIQNRNAFCLTCLNGLFIGRETYLLHNPAHATNFTLMYTKKLILITNRLISELDQNGILFKLFLVVLSFSTNLSILSHEKKYQEIHYDDYLKLNQYENIFIDLLWKYMLFKYEYHECIHRFSAMIKILLDLLDQLYQTEQMSKTKQLL